ncbi:glutamate receptor ionotropic, kainate glr-3-like [Daphnia pulex]|uniref:glutamate receptor ionotropic, kainate glr-3-like n=1 Tax=Daphnia pulex TaxID=6669 RepID=UPI001EE115DA|nr:glutamate receptor ionotropic, kainate glr-3-like [Daphnia pulex]
MRFIALELLFLVFLLIVFCKCQKINGHLRLATCYNPLGNLPNVSINKLGMIESQLIEMLAESLNFTYEIHVTTDVLQLGSPDEIHGNGSWTGILGQLVREEVDMTATFGPRLYSRDSVFDVTVPIILDNIAIVVPYPLQNIDAFAISNVYSPSMWILYSAANFAVGYVVWIVMYLKKGPEQKILTYQDILTNGVGIVFGQGGDLAGTRHRSLASRMIIGSWLFTVLVFDYAFTGSIISMITTPKLHFIVHSIGDVVANKDIQPLIINESSTHTEFKESSDPIYQEIYKRVRENPELLVSPSSEFVELLLSKPNQVLIMSDLLADSEIEKDFRRTGFCRATILPEKVKSRQNSLFLQKDSQFTKAINNQLLLLRQTGLSNYLDDTHHSFASRCYIDERKVENDKRNRRIAPLTLHDLRGFFGAFGGAVLGFIVFLVEICSAKCQCRSRVVKIDL